MSRVSRVLREKESRESRELPELVSKVFKDLLVWVYRVKKETKGIKATKER